MSQRPGEFNPWCQNTGAWDTFDIRGSNKDHNFHNLPHAGYMLGVLLGT